MRSLLVTTALVLPLSLGTAFAQDDATESVEDAAEETGEAVQETGEAAADTAEDAAQEVEETAEEAGDEASQEVEVETTDGGGAETETETIEAEEVDVETTESETDSPEAGASEPLQQEQGPNELRIDWITGATVMSPDGESIGNINDLIIDGENGQLTAAVVGVGGFLGIGQKQIAMSWDSLQIDYDANEITSDITQEEAEQAPEYVFRDQEQAPAAEGGTGGDTGMGTGGDTGGGMGTGGGTTGGVQ